MNKRQISQLLISMGLNPSLRGYQCLLHVLWLAANDKGFLLPPFKTLCKETASFLHISPASVQHCIRSLLRSFWDTPGSAELFSRTTGYPEKNYIPPLEFVAVVTDWLKRLDLR